MKFKIILIFLFLYFVDINCRDIGNIENGETKYEQVNDKFGKGEKVLNGNVDVNGNSKGKIIFEQLAESDKNLISETLNELEEFENEMKNFKKNEMKNVKRNVS